MQIQGEFVSTIMGFLKKKSHTHWFGQSQRKYMSRLIIHNTPVPGECSEPSVSLAFYSHCWEILPSLIPAISKACIMKC